MLRVDLDELRAALTLTQVGEDSYQAANLQLGGAIVFGGQILAQSAVAALIGQAGKSVKTMHTVFARPGASAKPLDVSIERVQAGRAFASGTVTFSQEDAVCARSMVLLSADEPDLIRHGDECAPGPPPAPGGDEGGAWRTVVAGGVDVRDPDQVGPPDLDVWSRWIGVPDDLGTSQALLALSTEGFLIGTAMRPHQGVGQSQAHRTLSTGVISHTITFHRPCDADAWVLLRQHSPFAGGGRAYGRGDIFTAGGQLVGSFAQDSMIRPMRPARSGRL
ncbi:acyl-CoA thioesterase [Pseudofrankia inefficax]|uniref:Acyl-CoA thioesterase n=1 Tax=Pseudofrankia inefficax (strain DSM 45817 / CECT 9037 / DDB 130130 / EuI1c) TaxID=298654 RepID=E3J7P4_PSEI1|nr:acyl-CoA thioesterase domain-containing protein [Pseudofrankia inefficax]ADP80798.1 acyl-CoA thioesterase [Pseudofrankia inefficax]